MNEAKLQSIGIFLTRLTLGLTVIAHSLYLKLVVFTLAGTAQFFAGIGLPEPLAYVVFFIEAAAGIALVLGLNVRLAAAVLVPVLAGATWAHRSAGWLFTYAGGGWEYPLFLTAAAAAQVCLGGGALRLRIRRRSPAADASTQIA